MKRKEIFEKVEAHLRAQGKVSRGSRGCMYRGPDGLKCAIGCLITDECYQPAIEGRSADHPSIIEALECSGIKVRMGDSRFLRQLQDIHDAHFPESWPEALAKFAKEYNL